jgi:hypothetical protein
MMRSKIACPLCRLVEEAVDDIAYFFNEGRWLAKGSSSSADERLFSVR